MLRAICQAKGRPIEEHLIEQLCQERLAAKAIPFLRLESEIVSALRNLRQAGVRVGLISNCAPEEVAAWDQCAIRPVFDDAIFSYRVGAMKPDPRIYLLACERLGVTPSRSMFVGDGGHDELVGAAEVGMAAYRANWFLSRWPERKRAQPGREASLSFPALASITEVVALATLSRTLS